MTTTLYRQSRGLRYDPELACQYLAQADPKLGELIARVGPCTLRPRATQSLFAALTRAIVYQQLSGSAAATILERVVDLFPETRFPRPKTSSPALPSGCVPPVSRPRRPSLSATSPRALSTGRSLRSQWCIA